MQKEPTRMSDFYKALFWPLLLGLFLSVATALAHIVLLGVSGWFITGMGLAGLTAATINYFTPAAIIRALAIVRTAGRYAERLVTHDAALRFIARFRPWIFERIYQLPLSKTDYLHSSILFDRLRGDLDHIEKSYLNGLQPAATAVVVAVVLVVAAFFIHMTAGIVAAVCAVIAGLIVPLAMHRSMKDGVARQDADKTALRLASTDMVAGLAEMSLFGRHDMAAGVMALQQRLISLQGTLGKREAAAQAIQAFVLTAGGFAAFGLCVMVFRSGGALLAALPLSFMGTVDLFIALPPALQVWLQARLAWLRLADTVQNEPEIAAVGNASNGLTLQNIYFRYNESAPFALQDISFSLPQGDALGIQGVTGSGKSSLIALISGLRMPQSGTLSGGCIARVAVAEQKPYIFSGTLRSNLLLGNPMASDDDLMKAVQIAGLDDMLKSMPDGFETRLGAQAQAQLSGGQMRRLSIARALLKQADVLILDEPDDGLDLPRAREVMQNIKNVCRTRGQSLIVISHNTQILDGIDRVVTLEQGCMRVAVH